VDNTVGSIKRRARGAFSVNRSTVLIALLIIFGFNFVTSLIASYIPLGGLTALIELVFIFPVFMAGTTLFYLNIIDGKNAHYLDVFKGFKQAWILFKTQLLANWVPILWGLLFFIPTFIIAGVQTMQTFSWMWNPWELAWVFFPLLAGIAAMVISSYAYSMSIYLVNDHPGIGAREAVKASKAMMKGQKMRFFRTQLSFIWWNLGALIVFFLLFLLMAAAPMLAIILLIFAALGYLALQFFYLAPYFNLTLASFYRTLIEERNNLSEEAFTLVDEAGFSKVNLQKS